MVVWFVGLLATMRKRVVLAIVPAMVFRFLATRLLRCKFRSKWIGTLDWHITLYRCVGFDSLAAFWAIPPDWSFENGEGYEAIGW